MENITLGQVSTLIAFLVALIGGIEFLAMRMRKYIKTTMKDEIDPLKEELCKNSLNTMKNTICNDNIPLSERIAVGKEYIDKGGNGAVKIYYHNLEEQYEKELKKGGEK
jgi:hypothetical protein